MHPLAARSAHRAHRRARSHQLLLLVMLVVVFALASPAHAGTIKYWSATQPMGTVNKALPITVLGNSSIDAYPLVPSSVRLVIDGAEVPRSSYNAVIGRTSLYVYYLPVPALEDGMRSFRVEVADEAGITSVRSWTANVKQPPTARWLSPGVASTISHGRPTFVLALADNTLDTRFTVAGEVRSGSATGPVIAGFTGTGLTAGTATFTLASELPPGSYYACAKITDAAGNSRTLSGSSALPFVTSSAPAMTVLSDCGDCHPTLAASHPVSPSADCGICHPAMTDDHMQGTGYCEDCHSGGWHTDGAGGPVAVRSSCTSCHNRARTEVLQHTSLSVAPSHNGSCGGCHTESVVTRHAVTPQGSAYANQCDLCHAGAAPRVTAAVAAGDPSCGACHDVGPDHGAFDAARHTSTESCLGTCHSQELAAAHDAEATTTVTDCGGCHAVKVAEVRPWDATCGACHPESHPTSGASHVGSDALVRDYTANFSVRTSMSWKSYPFGCSSTPSAGQVVCHDLTDLGTLHAELPNGGCSVCHTESGTQANARECISCHGTGWYNPASSSGTVARPGSDHSSSGAVVRAGGSGSDSYSTVVSNDGATSYLQFGSTDAEALFARGTWWMNPATTTITSVAVQFRAMKMGTATTASRMTVVLDVGGTIYASTAAATNPSATAWTLYTHTFTTNPRTGVAWTAEDLNDPTSANGLRAFGIRQTAADTAPIGVTEVLLKVTTPATNYSSYPVSGGTAHHYGDYLRSPETPAGEWSSAIYTQYCYDRCHVYPNTYAYYGQVLGNPTYNPFNAYEGTQMWSSLMGDPNGNSPLVRDLTLQPLALPAGASTLEFMTNYVLGVGDTAQVEASADGGSTWTTLSGTQGGEPVTVFTGTAGSWRLASYDLSAYAGQTVQVRFRYTQAPTSTTAGWCIDNVSISDGASVLFSDDAETLRPEWDDASHWRRIQYALRWLG